MKREEYISYWQRMMDDQSSSGMRISDWCRANNVQMSYFYKCRRRFRERQLISVGFIEIKPLGSESKGAGIRVVIDRGTYIEVERGFDPGVLRAVVGILSGGLRKSC